MTAAHGSTVYFHNAEANWGVFNSFLSTADGIDVGGERIADEIAALLISRPQTTQLSFVSLSLGGLYARYAVSALEQRGALTGLHLKNFLTLATPHLGVAGHLATIINVRGVNVSV